MIPTMVHTGGAMMQWGNRMMHTLNLCEFFGHPPYALICAGYESQRQYGLPDQVQASEIWVATITLVRVELTHRLPPELLYRSDIWPVPGPQFQYRLERDGTYEWLYRQGATG